MNTEKSFLLVGNGSYANRGCEAIVRGSLEILRREFGREIGLCAGVYGDGAEIRQQDRSEADASLRSFPLRVGAPRWSLDWFSAQANKRLGTRFPGVHTPLVRNLEDATAALEIGGDNYSLDYGIPRHFLAMDRFLRDHGVPVVIWGASIGPFDGEPDFAGEIFDHLRSLTAVFVRETASRDYLAQNDVVENVHLMADPAFAMKPRQPEDSKIGFEIPPNTVGLNFSPLMAKYFLKSSTPPCLMTEKELSPWIRFCTEAVVALAESAERPILLVPHVGSTAVGADDFRMLAIVARMAAAKTQFPVLSLPGGLGSEESKWAISQCSVFAGARTHSTIAALSSGVPTLSLGYSLKARGINQDIFGSQDYCISHSDLSREAFLESMNRLIADESRLRETLAEKIPEQIALAFAAGPALRAALEQA